MAEYQRVEYRIGKDGQIQETVINGSGESCTETTADIESALGEVTSQELLPEYYQGEDNQAYEETQVWQQDSNE
jgi:hypothetical protein